MCTSQVVGNDDLLDLNHDVRAPEPYLSNDLPALQADRPLPENESTAAMCCQGCGRRYHRSCILSATNSDPVSQLCSFISHVFCSRKVRYLPSFSEAARFLSLEGL